MECPNCKKQLADNAKTCPDCGYDFTEKENREASKATLGCLGLIIIVVAILVTSCVNSLFSDESSSNKPAEPKFTAEEVKSAENFITTLEAAGLITDIKTQCADGSQGCYYYMIDENLWNTAVKYETKEQLVMASEIYGKGNNKPFKFVEGKGNISGKKLFDIFGVKN